MQSVMMPLTSAHSIVHGAAMLLNAKTSLSLLLALMLALGAVQVGCTENPPSAKRVNNAQGDGDDDDTGGDGDGDAEGDGDTGGDGDSEGDGDSDTGDGDVTVGDGDQGDGDQGDGDGDAPAKELPKGVPADNGWTWVETEGSLCRNGSKAGYFYRRGTTKSLLIFLNGGGACADPFFCNLNPVDVNHDLPIEYLSHGAPDLLLGVRAQRQQALEQGIFERANPSNPVGKWNMIFVPYCTGDIYAGTRKDVEIPGVAGKQQFMGYHNYGLFLESFGPAFPGMDKILLTGSSAGGFGALFNGERTVDYFEKDGKQRVFIVSDSGVPLRDKYMATCLQNNWRTYWGMNDAFPKACKGCFRADGGGIVEGYGQYLFHEKFKGRMLGGFVSSLEDEVIRGFYSPGLNATEGGPDNCTLDPTGEIVKTAIIGGALYTGEKFHEGLADAIDNVVKRGTVGFYTIPGTAHMHLWRDRYYEKNGNAQTIAEWVKDVLDGKPTENGEL